METYEILIIGVIVMLTLFLPKKSREMVLGLLGAFTNKVSGMFKSLGSDDQPPKKKT